MNESSLKSLPPAILERLRDVLRRVRRIQAIKGAFATCAALLLSLLAIMAIDWAFAIQSNAVRWALSLSALAVTLYCLWRYLLRPLGKRISYARIARWVELHHPEMHERISTAVELSGRGDAGSQSLLEEVVREAAMDASHLNPKQELTVKAARRPMWTAVSAVALLGGLFAIFPKVAPMLFARAVAPFADLGNANALKIRLMTEDRQVVTAGDSFNVEAAYAGRQEQRAVMILTYPDGTEVREQMTEDATVKASGEERGISFRFPTQPPAQLPNTQP